MHEHDHRGVDHQPVGERVGVLAELRLDVPAAREPAVDLVGDRRRRRRRSPRPSCARRRPCETRTTKTGISTNRAIVSAFGSCAAARNGAGRHADKDSRRVARDRSTLPGLRQRALATPSSAPCAAAPRAATSGPGATSMLAEAERQTPETVRAEYVAGLPRDASPPATRRSASSTTSGSHEAHAAVEAAAEAGIELVLLLSAYARGGLPRFRQDSAGRLPRAGRGAARPRRARRRRPPLRAGLPAPTGSRRSARYAGAEGLPLHVHADEQPREIEECLAEHGVRPIELLARDRLPRAAHDGRPRDARRRAELDLLAEAGARVCVCPTTEANLGDGFAPVEALCERGIGDLHRLGLERPHRPARGAARARGHRAPRAPAGATSSPLERCSRFGSDEGAAALGLERWPDVEVDLEHPSLAGIDDGDVLGALVFGCGADVFSS